MRCSITLLPQGNCSVMSPTLSRPTSMRTTRLRRSHSHAPAAGPPSRSPARRWGATATASSFLRCTRRRATRRYTRPPAVRHSAGKSPSSPAAWTPHRCTTISTSARSGWRVAGRFGSRWRRASPTIRASPRRALWSSAFSITLAQDIHIRSLSARTPTRTCSFPATARETSLSRSQLSSMRPEIPMPRQ